MCRFKELHFYFFLLLIIPLQSLWAQESPKTNETAQLSISAGKKGSICSKSLQNCSIQISQNLPQCIARPGAITITNNSKIVAKNIQASSSDANFRTYVVQNNGCPSSLLPGRSCTITFSTNTSIAFFIPNVVVKGTNTSSTFFDMQSLRCAPQATISAPARAIIPTNDSVGIDITVLNISSIPASNVRVSLPTTWTSVTSTTCPVIPANGSCTITLTSNSSIPFAPRGGILVTGDNVASPPSIALAFSIEGYLVFSVKNSTSYVVSDSEPAFPSSWSSDKVNVPGVTETSTSPPDNCNGATDGYCNTSEITSFDPMSLAAGYCFFELFPSATWYLPSICELGTSGSAGCPANTSSIYTLYSLGFLTGVSGQYWSSTESSANPTNNAWFLNFTNQGAQGISDKFTSLKVRCARAF